MAAKTPATVRAAWIAAGATVIVGVLGLIATLVRPGPEVTQNTRIEDSPGAQAFQAGRDVHVHVQPGVAA